MGSNSGTFDKLENGKLSVLMSYTYFDENFNGTNKGKYYLDSSGGNKVTADKEVTKDQYFNTINPYINNYNYVAVGWDSIIPYVVDSTIDELRTNPYRWMNPNEVNGSYLAYDDVIYEVKGN